MMPATRVVLGRTVVALVLANAANAASPVDNGRRQYLQGDFSAAAASFEAAIRQDPGNSKLHHLLGKTRGRQAERAGFIRAPYYAAKCKAALEKAVELDPKNLLAWNDLFTYYLEAPSILGGGVSKARAAASKIASLSVAEGHWAQAQLAEKAKDWDEAERHYRSAAEAAPADAGRKIDVASFLARRGRHRESEEWFETAAALDPAHRLLPFEWSKAYVNSGREPERVRQMLQRYLQSEPTPDEPSRKEAEQLLRRIQGN